MEQIRAQLQNIIKIYKSPNLRFLTFTQKSEPNEPLYKAALRFRKSLSRLRARKWWTQRIKGYYLKHEATYNVERHAWHFHCHFLVLSGHIVKDDLKEEWHKASRGSYVIDVRATTPGTAEELSKYVTKYNAVPDEQIPELVEYLENHRMYSFGGAFTESRESQIPLESKPDWFYVGSLSMFVCLLDSYNPNHQDFQIAIYLYIHRREYPDLNDIILDDISYYLHNVASRRNNYYELLPTDVLDELRQQYEN